MADDTGRRRDFELRNRVDAAADRRSPLHTRRRSDTGRRSPFDTRRRSCTDRRRRSDNTEHRNRSRSSSSHYVRPDNELEDCSLSPKVIEKSRSYQHRQSYSSNVSPNPYSRRDNSFGTKLDSNRHLVHNRLDNEISNHNKASKNNNYQRKDIRGGNSHIKTPSWKENVTGMYSICVPNTENCDEVLNKIKIHVSPLSFYPYNKQYSNNKLNFIVDDYNVAVALQNTSSKITQRDERKLFINVFAYSPNRFLMSYTPVTNKEREKMLMAMATRYNPTTKSLDLSKFYACTLFTDNQLFVPLNRPAVLLAVLNMAAQHTRYDLYSLSLENNHIYVEEGLVWIRRLFPELKVLNLAGNKFSDFTVLKCLSGFQIEELNLLKNPLCDSIDNKCYRRAVQKLFPMLSKLDNIDLPYLYKPVIDSKFKMPVNLGNSYPIQQNGFEPNPVMALVELFLEKYYERYDDNVTRETVLDAYHDSATFSLSSCLLARNSKGSLAEYIPDSRNLFLRNVNKNKNNLLYKGKANIIHILKKLPKTKHDFGSFIIDVPLANSVIIQIVLNGVFAEEFNEQFNLQVFRSFCRTFTLVPSEKNGWIISSDMMFVTLVSFELMSESSKRFNMLEPPIKDHELNIDSLNTSNDTIMPDILSAKIYEPTILISPSSPHQLLSPLSPPRNQLQTSPCPSPSQISIVQNIQSTNQQQNHQCDSHSASSCSQNLNALFPEPKTLSVTSELPAISTSANRPSTELHLNTTNSPDSITRNENLMIKRFSEETGMNENWSKKCLVENLWNYGAAASCFTKLKHKIPSAAFKH